MTWLRSATVERQTYVKHNQQNGKKKGEEESTTTRFHNSLTQYLFNVLVSKNPSKKTLTVNKCILIVYTNKNNRELTSKNN